MGTCEVREEVREVERSERNWKAGKGERGVGCG